MELTRRVLSNLDAREVSLVKRGANRRKFLIAKSDNFDAGSLRELERHVDAEIAPVIEKLNQDRIAKAAGDGVDAQDDTSSQLSARAQAALAAIARILAPVADQLTDSDIDAIQAQLGMDGADGEDDDDDEEDKENEAEDDAENDPADDSEGTGGASIPDINVADAAPDELSMAKPDSVKPEHHQEAMAGAKDAYVNHLKQKGYKVGTQNEKDSPKEPVKKSDDTIADHRPEVIAKAIDDLQTQNKQLIEKSAKLEADLAIERADRENRELAVRAEKYKHLGVNKADLVSIMKTADGQGKEHTETLDRMLSALNEQARVNKSIPGGLMGELGSRLGADGDTSSPEAKLNEMAAQYVAKSSAPMTHAQAYTHLITHDPDAKRLFAESQSEHKKRGRQAMAGLL